MLGKETNNSSLFGEKYPQSTPLKTIDKMWNKILFSQYIIIIKKIE